MATVPIDSAPPQPPFRRGLSFLWEALGNRQSIKFFEIASAAALIVIAIISAVILTDKSPQAQPLSPAGAATLLVANLLPATFLLILFGRRVALKRAEQGNIASKQLLHVRLVAVFSAIAAVPTLLLVIFASILFQSGVQFWSSNAARGMIENSVALANGYYEEKVRDVGDETTKMAADFRFSLGQTRPDDPAFLDAYYQQVLLRKLSESAIVTIGADGKQRTAAVVSPDDDRRSQWIDADTLKKLRGGEDLVVSVKPDRVEGVIVLFKNPESYLYTKRAVTVPSYRLSEKAHSVLKDYEDMVARSRSLQLKFNLALYFISLIIIGLTLWIALRVADRLVGPVTGLVQAAQKIADGDLSARVAENPDQFDEIAFLAQSFNRMTERLESQTGDLRTTNRQLDDRRAFIEAVLESVSAGVVSVDDAGVIQLANSTAEKLLAKDNDSIVGQSFASLSPELAHLADEKQRGVVQLGDGPEPLTMAVKISEREGGKVVTFEDISQQLADQRRAAWSDVARRIAHEIKNPLTPIQLAAERLKRRFGKQIVDGNDVFEQLTGTIVRQVGDLRNIVDEFSSFARMPKPILRPENLTDIVGHAVFLFEVAHSDIDFSFDHDDEQPTLICDRRQLGQAITNILKNAVESIEERKKSSEDPGRIVVNLICNAEGVEVTFLDNGTGLPADRDRIVEPYVTTRPTGSGLGLAIVQKIIEEHSAEISFQDAEQGGALVTMKFPAALVENTSEEEA